MSQIRYRSTNPKIIEMADTLIETLVAIYEHESSQYLDISEQIRGVMNVPEHKKQLQTLKLIDNALHQKNLMHDKIGNYELGVLIETYQRLL